MTSFIQWLRLINQMSRGGAVFMLISLAMPVLLLAGVGSYFVVTSGYGLALVLVMLGLVLIGLLPIYCYQRSQKKQRTKLIATDYVQTDASWSEHEQEIWQQLNDAIETKLKRCSDWDFAQVKEHSFELALETAQAYGKNELDFTVIEALQLLDKVSSRYICTLGDIVPGIDTVKISHAKSIYHWHDKYGAKLKSTYHVLHSAWRILRLTNPATGLVSELRAQLFDNLTEQGMSNLRYNSLRAFYQELVQVLMDLYSGRFELEAQVITSSTAHQADQQRMSPEPGRLRIVVVGQENSGKSSLINQLLQAINAEVGALPVTENINVYERLIDNALELNLVDTPGLDGSDEKLQTAYQQILDADLVLWLLRANQPARALDVQLQEKVTAYYSDKNHISKNRPAIIAVVTQVDRLKPRNHWQPSYDLHASDSPKAQTIAAAVQANRELLTIADAVLPLAIPAGQQAFGVLELEAEIQNRYETGIATQLNRRRHEAKEGNKITRETKRLFKLCATGISPPYS